jgi:hypothetical protein
MLCTMLTPLDICGWENEAIYEVIKQTNTSICSMILFYGMEV